MDNYQTCSSVPFSKGAAVQVLHNNLGNRGPHKGSSALQENLGILWLMEASHENPVANPKCHNFDCPICCPFDPGQLKTESCYRVTDILSSSLHKVNTDVEDFKSWSWCIPKSLIFLVGQSPKKHQKIHVSEQEIGFFWLNSRPSLHQNIWRYKASGIQNEKISLWISWVGVWWLLDIVGHGWEEIKV